MLHRTITRDQGRARHVGQAVRQGCGETGGGSARPARPAQTEERDVRAARAGRRAGARPGGGGRRRRLGGGQGSPCPLRSRPRSLGPGPARRPGRSAGLDRPGRTGGQGAPGDRPADIRGAPHQLGLGSAYLRARCERHAGAVARLPRAARDRRGTAARSRRAAARLGHPVASPPHLGSWHVPGPRRQRDPARRRPAPRPAGPGDPHRVGVPAAAPVERRARPGPGVRPRSLHAARPTDTASAV